MSRSRFLLAGAAAVVAACQPAALSDAQRSEIADGVKAAHHALFASVTTRNADTVMSYFLPDDRLTWAMNGSVFPSHDSIMRTARAYFAAARSMTMTSAEPKITVLGPDAAALTTTFRESVTDTSGHTDQMTYAWTAVYQRELGAWKVMSVHESLLAPPPAPAVVRRRS